MSKKINEQEILELFFSEEREYHLREVARQCGITPVSAKKYLEAFAKNGLLERREERGNLLYSPSRNQSYAFEKSIHNLRTIRGSGLVTFLERELEYPAVVLFGSYAKGENRPDSDIDLFIIADTKKKLDVRAYEKRLSTTIHLFLHTPQEFGKMQKENPELLNNALNGIILTGYLEVF